MTGDPTVRAETSEGTDPGPSWHRILLYAFAVATPLGWIAVAVVYVGMNSWGRTITFERAVIAGLPDWYIWAALTPLLVWLAERFRIERGRRAGTVAIHLLAATVVALGEILAVVGVNALFGVSLADGGFLDVYLRMVLRYFHFNFIIYCAIVTAAHAAGYYRAYRERELATSRLQEELTQAQLAALRMQLQPHFFFNTLHTIAGLVRDGRYEDSIDTIARLGDLLRATLGSANRDEIPLREELGFVERYLAIEATRFADRLAVHMDVEPATLDARVPYLALQPLVENAIRHGIALDPAAHSITVESRRANGSLRIEIRNDGPPWGTEPARPRRPGSGVGLRNVRARLHRLYGTRFRLDVGPGQGRETIALLEIPWRVAADAAPREVA